MWVSQFAAFTKGGPTPADAKASRTPSEAWQNRTSWRAAVDDRDIAVGSRASVTSATNR
jgi:hypothetical protein